MTQTQRSIPWRTIAITALVIVPIALAVLLVHRPPRAVPTPAAASSTTAAAADGSSTTSATPGAQDQASVAATFARLYAARGSDDARWLASLAPYTTPAFQASLAGSDRRLAQAAGPTVLEQTDTAASVGTPAQTAYSIHLEAAPSDDENVGQDPKYLVASLDYINAPAGAAVPLASDALEELRPALQQAAAAVLAQPAGATDADRAAGIREVYSDPQQALTIPRTADANTSVRIGAARDLALSVEDQGLLAAYATVPYSPDGNPNPRWIALTITLSRDGHGAWVPADVRA